MAIELERRELRSFKIRKSKYKQRITIIVLIVVFLIIGFLIYTINALLHKDYTSYQVLHSVDKIGSGSAQYQSYGSNVLRYSRDGAMAMDVQGNLLWNGSFEMKDPIVDSCDKYVAVSDRGYKEIQIFNGQGKVSPINVLKPIIKTEVANQGVIAVLMDGGDDNYIDMYSEDGEYLVGVRTLGKKDGFPVDIALSDDGRKLVTSYVSLKDGIVNNMITFRNFGEVGQNYEDKIVGSFDNGQTIVPHIEFMNNDWVCAFGDDKLSVYSMRQLPSLKFEKTIPSEIKSIFYSDKYVGLVIDNTEGEDKYRVLLYDLEGKEVLNKTTNYNYDNVYLSGDELVFYSDLEWFIWKTNGEVKLHYKFDSNILYIMPINNLDKYIIIDELTMQEVKLIEKQSE